MYLDSESMSLMLLYINLLFTNDEKSLRSSSIIISAVMFTHSLIIVVVYFNLKIKIPGINVVICAQGTVIMRLDDTQNVKGNVKYHHKLPDYREPTLVTLSSSLLYRTHSHRSHKTVDKT